MKRDMELCRKILFKLEEVDDGMAIYDFAVDEYDMNTVAYHCRLLYEVGFIGDYKAQYAGNGLYSFYISQLTWEGHEFLDKIREDTVWNKTKEVITKKGLPMVVDVIKTVATSVVTSMTEAAIKAIL